MEAEKHYEMVLTATELSKRLQISERHLVNLNATGRLPRPIRLGRSVRWRADKLRDWLDAGCPARDRWEAMREGGTP